jgi:BirA family biotin operon repressor/biotin-[acetyl-CoA-carboxylase] ligase
MIITYDQIDSTNRVATQLIAEGEVCPGTVVRSTSQSAGKGQYGRNFNSPVGGLYFSLILKPDLKPEHLSLITLATGLACRNVIHAAFGLHPQIKWPNDIYLEQRKLAGILCENIFNNEKGEISSTVVIGVGLNVNTTRNDFPPEIKPLITTLFDHIQQRIDLDWLLSLLMASITEHVNLLSIDPQWILEQWQLHDYLWQKKVIHTSGSVTIEGIARGVTAQGFYQIQDDAGIKHSVVGGQLRPLPLRSL